MIAAMIAAYIVLGLIAVSVGFLALWLIGGLVERWLPEDPDTPCWLGRITIGVVAALFIAGVTGFIWVVGEEVARWLGVS